MTPPSVVLRSPPMLPPPPEEPTANIAATARILVVDDVVLNQRVITMKLQQRGYTNIDVASDGEEALEKVRTSTVLYSLILMDVSMPGLDGYETTRRIKADPRFATVPIVGITGNTTSEDIATCLASGMVSVLAKPIDTDKLFEVLKAYLINTPGQMNSIDHLRDILTSESPSPHSQFGLVPQSEGMTLQTIPEIPWGDGTGAGPSGSSPRLSSPRSSVVADRRQFGARQEPN